MLFLQSSFVFSFSICSQINLSLFFIALSNMTFILQFSLFTVSSMASQYEGSSFSDDNFMARLLMHIFSEFLSFKELHSVKSAFPLVVILLTSKILQLSIHSWFLLHFSSHVNGLDVIVVDVDEIPACCFCGNCAIITRTANIPTIISIITNLFDSTGITLFFRLILLLILSFILASLFNFFLSNLFLLRN